MLLQNVVLVLPEGRAGVGGGLWSRNTKEIVIKRFSSPHRQQCPGQLQLLLAKI